MASPTSKKVLVSACLAGINCTYLGKNNTHPKIKKLFEEGDALALCPEVFAGLGVPRENIELVDGDGRKALKGAARAVTALGTDVTERLIAGAKKALKAAQKYDITEAVLKSNSPACGCGHIYDGSFSKKLKEGDGVLAALLKESGISVRTEKEV